MWNREPRKRDQAWAPAPKPHPGSRGPRTPECVVPEGGRGPRAGWRDDLFANERLRVSAPAVRLGRIAWPRSARLLVQDDAGGGGTTKRTNPKSGGHARSSAEDRLERQALPLGRRMVAEQGPGTRAGTCSDALRRGVIPFCR